jgi:serine/threonine-protein kinase
MICPRCHERYADPAPERCRHDDEPLTMVPEIELVASQPTEDEGIAYAKRYLVRGLLGEGAMSRVFLAEDAFTKELAAIKVLAGPDARVEEARERFFREVRTTEALAHPGIVHLLEAGQRKDGSPFLVMEYLFGETLGDRLRRDGWLSMKESLWIARQAASALRAAHHAGVIHRDIKPDNIFLIGERGKPRGLKILDFGLARLQGESGFTALGVTVGTLEYMAPEQVVKDNTGPRTDMYALGVVLYRMITGILPFGGSEAELLAQHLVLEPPPPSDHVPGFDPRIEAAILTAIRKLPRNRYPSMEDFVVDLDRLIAEEPGEVGSPVWENDVYVPQTPYGRKVASFLYGKLGREMPAW